MLTPLTANSSSFSAKSSRCVFVFNYLVENKNIMKNIILFLALFFSVSSISAQYEYAASSEQPFGKPNPKAPKQITDYEGMIGSCNCTSTTRNQDGSWTKPENIIWSWKYIMNGMGVQDETLKPDGSHSGSIRQYIADSSR